MPCEKKPGRETGREKAGDQGAWNGSQKMETADESKETDRKKAVRK